MPLGRIVGGKWASTPKRFHCPVGPPHEDAGGQVAAAYFGSFGGAIGNPAAIARPVTINASDRAGRRAAAG